MITSQDIFSMYNVVITIGILIGSIILGIAFYYFGIGVFNAVVIFFISESLGVFLGSTMNEKHKNNT